MSIGHLKIKRTIYPIEFFNNNGILRFLHKGYI